MAKALPHLAADAAFFIDFDGTLVAIAARPDLVRVEPGVIALLRRLAGRFDGAVAVVTGRSLATVDALLAPLKLPIAAEHGSVRRDAAGLVHGDSQSAATIALVAARLEPLVEANPGLLLERKTASVALHYRQRPELGQICAEAVRAATANLAELSVLPGKMVYEVRPQGADKGTAVEAFLGEAPFAGRVPVYIGDDLTDEHAFAAVNALGGVTIKLGEGETLAQYRAAREDFLSWCVAQSVSGKGTV
ncbi:MAG: trehalose-phosphatase [Methyloceanibacter sp.]